MERDESQGSVIGKIIGAAFRLQALVVMLAGLALLLGIAAYRQMPRNIYPEITLPTFTIVTQNEAMAAEEIETAITRPMEAAMNGLPGLQHVRSQSAQGASTVVVEFDTATDFQHARQLLSERMTQAAAQLPPGTQPSSLSGASTSRADI